MIGIVLILTGLVLKVVSFVLRQKSKPYGDEEWNQDVAEAMYRLNVKEAETYARALSRHIDPKRN